MATENKVARTEPSRGAPEAAHTPGPWRAAMHLIGDDPRWFIEHEGVFIKTATIAAMNTTCMAYDNAEADAALIAQAPTLLAENERLRKIVIESDDLVRAEQAEDRLQKVQAGHVVLLEALSGLIEAISQREDKHGERFAPEILHACAVAEAAIQQTERT